jgi:ADP-ribose pyrophosphatase YjhB (NUDIX family)
VDYLRASAAHGAFVARADELGNLSDQEQAIQREFIRQIGADPSHPSIPAMADAAARTTKRRMLAHVRYEAAKNAWEDASRDVQTTEELQTREQAFADALEISAYRRHLAQGEEGEAAMMVVH